MREGEGSEGSTIQNHPRVQSTDPYEREAERAYQGVPFPRRACVWGLRLRTSASRMRAPPYSPSRPPQAGSQTGEATPGRNSGHMGQRSGELATAQDRNVTPELTVRDQPTDVGL